eukprot:2974737-Alexandrium_andersonii.AAC.1
MKGNSLPMMDVFLQQGEEDWEQLAKDAQDFDILQEQELHRKRDAEYLEATCSPGRSRRSPLHRRCSRAGGKER